MISIVQQTLDFYLSKMSAPDVTDIELSNEELASTKWSCFVTIFLKWEVRWSAGNIKDVLGNGVIVIKKDYTKTATILPNIDPKIISGNDYQDILSAKLEEPFEEDKYIIYEIETIVERDY